MMNAAVEAARRGLTVVRLQQGNPVVHVHAGIRTARRPRHLICTRGIFFAGIPVTQRGIAECVVVCTGVRRKGKEVKLPGYELTQTVLILMGVARMAQVVSAMMRNGGGSGAGLHREGRW